MLIHDISAASDGVIKSTSNCEAPLCRNHDKYIIIAAKYTQRSLQISSHHLQLIRLGRLVLTCSDCNSVPNIPMFLELQGPINGYRASLLAVGIRLIRRLASSTPRVVIHFAGAENAAKFWPRLTAVRVVFAVCSSWHPPKTIDPIPS